MRYDAIIVGGGHNGLVCAAYLAKAGRRVLVLERREMLGGCAVTEELWPGYKVSTGAYLVSLMQERIVRELELERHGYQVLPKTPRSSLFTPTEGICFSGRTNARRWPRLPGSANATRSSFRSTRRGWKAWRGLWRAYCW